MSQLGQSATPSFVVGTAGLAPIADAGGTIPGGEYRATAAVPHQAAVPDDSRGDRDGPILLQKSGLEEPSRREFEVGFEHLVAARSASSPSLF
jgi:hypothetical protein